MFEYACTLIAIYSASKDGRAMRIIFTYLLVLSLGLVAAQTSQTMRDHYGTPDIERFTVRGDIGVTVLYGSDREVCQMVVERKQPLLHNQESLTYMDPQAVTEIIDELVPPTSRGRSIGSMLESMGCAEERIEEYENVWVSRNLNVCIPLKRESESTTAVVFKRQTCPVSPYAKIHD